jgi:hypothetical protein
MLRGKIVEVRAAALTSVHQDHWRVMMPTKRITPVIKICEYCGASYAVRLKFRMKQRFCSSACFFAHFPQTVEEAFWANVPADRTDEGCWVWQGAMQGNYGHIRVGGPKAPGHRAHRVSWEIHNGPIPDGLYVCHDCPGGDNPLCVNPRHLFLGTALDNNRDRLRKVGGRRLSQEHVREIRRAYAAGVTSLELMSQYGVGHSAIHYIVTGRMWSSVPQEEIGTRTKRRTPKHNAALAASLIETYRKRKQAQPPGKVCSRCKERKGEDEFGRTNRKNSAGVYYLNSMCRTCCASYQRELRAKRKEVV